MSQTGIERLRAIMKTLRDPERGCAWDCAQNHATLAPYAIEEAYEVVDAIERGDPDALQDELGDLLLQVVFHAELAHEQHSFDFDTIANHAADKMEARHPHIFGGERGSMDEARWELVKQREREARGETSAMEGVARALPALLRAHKLQKRAAAQGFDWPDWGGARDKLLEELAELEEARGNSAVEEEAGDLLFAVVNLVRKRGVSAEEALRRANLKFERRYRAMEELVSKLSELSLSEQEELWQTVKRAERE
jgi:ATP diphosphatase